MDTKDAVGLSIGEDLDEAVSVRVGASAASCREGEFSRLVDDPGALQLLLGLADRSDLGPSVDDRRDGVIVEMRLLTRQHLGQYGTLVLRLMCQHRTGDNIADGIDSRDVGLIMRIDFDALLVVERDADLLQAEPVGKRAPADGDQNYVRAELDRKSVV